MTADRPPSSDVERVGPGLAALAVPLVALAIVFTVTAAAAVNLHDDGRGWAAHVASGVLLTGLLLAVADAIRRRHAAYASTDRVIAYADRLLVFASVPTLVTGGIALVVAIRDHESVVLWTAAGALVLTGVTASISASISSLRSDPRERRRRRARVHRDDWDVRTLFTQVGHWQPPTDDSDELSAAQEVHELEAIALARASLHRGRAARWQVAQYAIGLPAALFAGASGATGLTDLQGPARTALGVVGLVGSGLTSLATALNAGRRAEESGAAETQYESIARGAHVLRRASRDLDETEVRQLVARFDHVSGAAARAT